MNKVKYTFHYILTSVLGKCFESINFNCILLFLVFIVLSSVVVLTQSGQFRVVPVLHSVSDVDFTLVYISFHLIFLPPFILPSLCHDFCLFLFFTHSLILLSINSSIHLSIHSVTNSFTYSFPDKIL